MARKAKFKAGEQVSYSLHGDQRSLFIGTKGQYSYRNKSVVDLIDASGLIVYNRVAVNEVERLPEATPQPITNSVLRGTAEQVTDTCAPNPDCIKTVNETLDERGNRYGDFTDHAVLAQNLQDVIRDSVRKHKDGGYAHGWHYLNAVQKQALTVIADKIARILNGDPNYADNWHDIQGYAKLVEDRLPKAE